MIDKQLIGEKILSIRNNHSLKQAKFAESLGISQQALSQIEKGISLPSLDLLQKITSIYRIEYNYLLSENYRPLGLEAAAHSAVHSPLDVLPISKGALMSGGGVPYYDALPVSAGDPLAFLQQAKPTSFIGLPQLSDCAAVLPVYGSSMKGVVEPGDLIAIREVKSRDEFDPSVPYMVITEEHRMVKYLRVDEEDQSVVWAESTNHSKIRLAADNIKMVYAIKCVIRFY